jgi:glycerate-2-kinase
MAPPPLTAAPDVVRRLVEGVLAAVEPGGRVREALGPTAGGFGAVFALGKAGAALWRGAAEALASAAPARALVVRPHDAVGVGVTGVEELTGGHPLPDAGSVAAGRRLAAWLRGLPAAGRLLALISGGGSACLELPAPGLTLAELAATQRALLASGLPIDAVNAVRKHLSALKGGGALRLAPCAVTVLVLSDVRGDDPATVASGPFAADPTTHADALAAVAGLAVPPRVVAHLTAGARGERPETLKPGEATRARAEHRLLAGNGTAVAAAAALLAAAGFAVETGELAGEAARAGEDLVARGRGFVARRPGGRVAVLLGGETTVRLLPPPPPQARGGRNQELALAAARALAAGGTGRESVVALATDGVDGATPAAGAVVDGTTWRRLIAAGAAPERALAGHDSHGALAAVPDSLLVTGPTGTNVADVVAYLGW